MYACWRAGRPIRVSVGRKQISIVAVAVAVLVAGQVGYVGYRQAERSAAISRELEELDRESRRAIDKLTRQLDMERLKRSDLQDAYARAEDLADELKSDLKAVASRAAALEPLLNEPPPLEIYMSPAEGLHSFIVSARNPGTRAVEIVGAEGTVWLDGEESGFGRSEQVVNVPPDEAAEFFEYNLLGEEPSKVEAGQSVFRGALCFAAERTFDETSATWATQYWFEYNPALEMVSIVYREAWPVEAERPACDLQAAAPPWTDRRW